MKALENYRRQIDALDDQIIKLLVKRFDIVHTVGAVKAKEGIKVVQSERAQQVIDRNAKMAESHGLNGDLLRAIYTAIIDHAHVLEHDIVDNDAAED